MTLAFDQLERSPQGHFRLYAYQAVFHILNLVRRPGGEALPERFPFLRGYHEELRRFLPPDLAWSEAERWWSEQITAWEASCESPLPLRRLAAALRLDGTALTAIALIGLVEEDGRFRLLFQHLQGARRPTLELVTRLISPGEDLAPAQALLRSLLAVGLVAAVNPEAPRAEWELSVPALLWDGLRGEPVETASWVRHIPHEQLTPVTELFVDDAARAQIERVPGLIREGQVHLLIARGGPGSEREQALGAAVQPLGLGLLVVAEGHAGRASEAVLLAALLGAMPVLTYELAPGEKVSLPPLLPTGGPIGIQMGHEGGVEGEMASRSLTITLSLPSRDLRRRLWSRALGKSPDLDLISDQFLLPSGLIRRAAELAKRRAAVAGRAEVLADDVRQACRELNHQGLGTLAVRMEAEGGWSELVLSPGTMAKLRELEQRCRHRERLLGHLRRAYGPSGRGVRALLSGPSGTGKTLAARTLAAVLKMEIYRVDLAAVVNKYIGETEKNLNQVLSRAEELDVILLLDEGDALLARRTAVQSSNDRYANLETNYLLQRLEQYQGILLITTNAAEQIDPGFKRRMDVVVPFLAPRPDERLRIWQQHLPERHELQEAALMEIAQRYGLTGGQIRNAAIHAAMLALEDRGSVGPRHIEEAIRSEYRKAGAIGPQAGPSSVRRRSAVSSFLDALSK